MATEIDRINSRGLSHGWHAEMLANWARRLGRTMADLHAESVVGASAFNVPAEATGIRGGRVHYRFMDGSTISYPHQKREH